MELEGTWDHILILGPKKYLKSNAEYYEYRGNGIPAKSNMYTDILDSFQKVVRNKETVSVKYFSIEKKNKSFDLVHTDSG